MDFYTGREARDGSAFRCRNHLRERGCTSSVNYGELVNATCSLLCCYDLSNLRVAVVK